MLGNILGWDVFRKWKKPVIAVPRKVSVDGKINKIPKSHPHILKVQ
jgi:hypothetical protein